MHKKTSVLSAIRNLSLMSELRLPEVIKNKNRKNQQINELKTIQEGH